VTILSSPPFCRILTENDWPSIRIDTDTPLERSALSPP
jgi:hypothetical protein